MIGKAADQQASADVPAEKAPDSGMADGIRIVWRTDIGRIRQNNQDAVIIGNGLAGVKVRMRAEWRGDTENAAKNSVWRYVKFVR